MKIKKPHFKKPNIKNILKFGVKILTNMVTTVLISGGVAGLFLSYINPTPYIARYYPELQIGYYTLNTLYSDIQYLQSLGYISYSISGGLIVLGLIIHIRSIGRLWRGIKATPRAIYNFPMNTYRKLKVWRDWLLKTISYLNEESDRWRRTFNVLKSPYSLLRAFGLSPQLAISLLAIGGTAGGGIAVNELIEERNFSNGDAGIYAAPNNVPDATLEETMKWREENKEDNTLRIVLAATPVSSIGIYDVTVGTAYASSTLPSNTTEAVLVSGGTNTRLKVGTLIFEKSRCKSLDVSDITAYKIVAEYNASDGQSISQTAGTGRMRAIGGGHHTAKAMETKGGTYDRIWIDSPAHNGQVDELILSNLLTKGGTCTLKKMDVGVLIIRLNEIGMGNGFATKEFTIATTATAQIWEVTANVETYIAEATTQ